MITNFSLEKAKIGFRSNIRVFLGNKTNQGKSLKLIIISEKQSKNEVIIFIYVTHQFSVMGHIYNIC